MVNPRSDDLASAWTKSRAEPKKPERDEPAEHYREKDETLRRIESIWGPVERVLRPRQGEN